MKLSLVIPVYNEEENLPLLWQEIQTAVIPLNIPWDVTFVDDGSKDRSAEVLRELAAQDPEHVQVVLLNRNYGQTAAITAGIDHSDGDVIILMDADLQNDPADIPLLLEELNKAMMWSAAGEKTARITN